MSPKQNPQILTVLGAGNMGTAVAQVLADNGHEVNIWNWEGDHAPLKQIERYGENKRYLPNVKLSNNIVVKYDIEDALFDSEIVFFVIPSGVLEHTVSFAARSIEHNAVLVDVSKGVEPHSLRLMPHIICKHVRPKLKSNIVTISGPAMASQMARKHFTAMNIASKNRRAINKVRKVMENDYIKLVPTADVIGVEVGGSFKNVYAIAIGMCDGMGYRLNTKAALLTFALQEIAELIKAMGGRKQTAYELAGVGDLIGTSFSPESRNRTFGEYIGKGITGSQAQKKVRGTIEGIPAAKCLLNLAKKHKIPVPFANLIFKCINTKGDPRKIFREFIHSL